MGSSKDLSTEIRKEQVCYFLNGITYLPHYKYFGMYVYPGFTGKGTKQRMIEKNELLKAKATKVIKYLWERKYEECEYE